MEATVLSLGRSVLDGALSYAKSAVAEEVALQLGVQRDLAFIRDEFEMMQSFLMAADEKQIKKQVVTTWVKQVRDLAYDVEDCLQDFALHLKNPSRWGFPCTVQERHRIATEIKEMKARVEDVSQRSLRYRLIEDSSSQPATFAEQQGTPSSAIFGIDEARRAAEEEKPRVNLGQLITTGDKALRVVAVWGTSGDHGKTSIIKEAYDDPEIHGKFECRAWVKLMHPFDPKEFLRSLLRQFYGNSLKETAKVQEGATVGAHVSKKMGAMEQDHLFDEFDEHVNTQSYLIVIDDLSTVVEWEWIKTYLPDKKNGSRVVVSAQQVEIASLCTEQPNQVSELKQCSPDQTLYLFYKKDSQPAVGSDSSQIKLEHNSSTNNATAAEIEEDQSVGLRGGSLPGLGLNKDSNMGVGKNLTRVRKMEAALDEAQLIGREREKSEIIQLVSDDSECHQVIAVLGMGGLGKTTLVRSIYESQELSGKFQKRAWVTVLHPFNRGEFFRSLVLQLHEDSAEKKEKTNISMLGGGIQKQLVMMGIDNLIEKSIELLQEHKYLIVLDDLSSNAEWKLTISRLPENKKASRIIVTTRDEIVAANCSKQLKLKPLEYEAALDLFKKKVFRETENFELNPDMMKEAKLIIKKCSGLPLAIATIGGFLATRPQNTREWRNLNDHISAELESNPRLEEIKTVLTSSYEGLPYHLKSCFLYLSIFPEDHNIRRRRLVRRWIAEGYSREMRSKNVEEVAEEQFTNLINRSMIQPSKTVISKSGKIDFCQVHDLMREISISKSEEENLVFILDEIVTLHSGDKVRHLVVSSSWSRDKKVVLERVMDVSHIRSLTVFGEWRSFFISRKMRLLRVLDLEDVSGLSDCDLVPIGKLRHLKCLSLRGCGVFRLPYSLGNLSNLETLDIRGTCVIKLPATVVKLQKLKYLRAGHDGYLSIGVNPGSVKVPRGIGKLSALHTLGVVDVARGKAMLKELKKLTQLRKLGVLGIDRKNCKALCSAIADFCQGLRSLSMSTKDALELEGCLDDMSPPPKDLQSLKLGGNLVKLPKWVEQLHNLAKLSLRGTKLDDGAATIKVLGKLPNLTILRLWWLWFKIGDLHLRFPPKDFQSLMVLELVVWNDFVSIKFEGGAMPKLELLHVEASGVVELSQLQVSGLQFLSSLKQVSLRGGCPSKFKQDLQDQLANNLNTPNLKIGD